MRAGEAAGLIVIAIGLALVALCGVAVGVLLRGLA